MYYMPLLFNWSLNGNYRLDDDGFLEDVLLELAERVDDDVVVEELVPRVVVPVLCEVPLVVVVVVVLVA